MTKSVGISLFLMTIGTEADLRPYESDRIEQK